MGEKRLGWAARQRRSKKRKEVGIGAGSRTEGYSKK